MGQEQFLQSIYDDIAFYKGGKHDFSPADIILMRKIALSQFDELGFSGDNPPPFTIFCAQMSAVVENYIKTRTSPENP